MCFTKHHNDKILATNTAHNLSEVVMETPTGSGDITVRRLRARLARQNARWRLFSRRHPDHTQSHFIAERERHQSQSREIQLAIARSTPPARRFVNRWNLRELWFPVGTVARPCGWMRESQEVVFHNLDSCFVVKVDVLCCRRCPRLLHC